MIYSKARDTWMPLPNLNITVEKWNDGDPPTIYKFQSALIKSMYWKLTSRLTCHATDAQPHDIKISYGNDIEEIVNVAYGDTPTTYELILLSEDERVVYEEAHDMENYTRLEAYVAFQRGTAVECPFDLTSGKREFKDINDFKNKYKC